MLFAKREVSFLKRFDALRRNRFIRSTSVLVGGTAAAQALTVLTLPILTRLYTPQDFSLLSVYVAILTILAVIACLRLEIAIPLPEDDIEAANLLVLALLFTTLFALLLALVVYFFSGYFFLVIGHQGLQPFSWLFPFGVLLAGYYAAFQYWSTRKKRFGDIARSRMVQVGVGLSAQLGLGWAGFGSIGLMLGHALISSAGAIRLAVRTWQSDNSSVRAVSWDGMRVALYRYRRFPLYSTWDALANNAAIQIPTIFIASVAAGPEAGFLLLATRALGTPVTLIGGAVSQVYLARAPEALRNGTLFQLTVNVLRGLAAVSVAPLVIIAIIAPSLFSFAFGKEWLRAGELAGWMMPWFILKLLSSPVSMVMHVKLHQKAMLGLTLFGFFLRISMVTGAHFVFDKFETEAYAVSSAIFYFIALVVFLRVAK